MKITFFEMEDREKLVLLDLYPAAAFESIREPLDRNNAAQYADAEIISCFIYSDLSAEVLQKFEKLKMIATRSSGFDHIDTEYCRANGIIVSTVPAYGEHTVAEHVFALLLSLSRHIPEAVQRTREGSFSFKGLEGFDLYEKTIGIIGTGSIGLHTAKIAKGFGMKVLGFDISPRNKMADEIGFSYVDLKELLKNSDIITLHVPGGVLTEFLLSEDEFLLMKEGVVIINTARGSLINPKALLQALNEGKVKAAGLDVLPEEPLIREEAELLRASFVQKHALEALWVDHALTRHKNVIVTPHMAFYTREAVERILITTHENVTCFLNGKPQNVVNTGFLRPVELATELHQPLT